MDKLGPYELNTAILGDCIEVMRQIPDNSIDSIVTDSPYGLSKEPDMIEVLTHWLNGDDYEHRGGGFMGKSWDSFVPGPAVWRECFRVMKPGGCLMAFGGTRTCDLLSIAIRLAGFQRFDSLCWLHSQGFGKGIAVDKGIDSLLGKAGEREVIGRKIYADGKTRTSGENGTMHEGWQRPWREKDKDRQEYITAPATEAAALFNGWRSQLKPSHEVILCFWKPREKSFAHNALKWGVAGLNIDGCRIAVSEDDKEAIVKKHESFNGSHKDNFKDGWRRPWMEQEDADEKIKTQQQKAIDEMIANGRFPANVLLSHHESCVRVGVKQVRGSDRPGHEGKTSHAELFGKKPHMHSSIRHADPDGMEVVPDYRCHPDCPVWQLDRQAGVRKSGGRKGTYNGQGAFSQSPRPSQNGKPVNEVEASTGSASRFFYTPKAPPREKWFYCEICDDCYPYKERDDHAHGKSKGQRKHQIAHPTVKPLSIVNYTLGVLEYLCRLTKTPTGGIVLDPFGGSGTTALAAIANGRPFLLIENDPIYHRIAQKRIEQAMKEPKQLRII